MTTTQYTEFTGILLLFDFASNLECVGKGIEFLKNHKYIFKIVTTIIIILSNIIIFAFNLKLGKTKPLYIKM